MQAILIKGFLVGLSYLAPIGMQNLYVIQAGLTQTRKRTYFVVLTTVFFDLLLGLAGFFGFGYLFLQFPVLKLVLLLIGGALILWIGVTIIKSKPDLEQKQNRYESKVQIIMACFLVTWANPQSVLSGTVLFGGFRASIPEELAYFFVLGSSLASISWFFFLGTTAQFLKSYLRPRILIAINVICGVILLYCGGQLLVQAIPLIRELFGT